MKSEILLAIGSHKNLSDQWMQIADLYTQYKYSHAKNVLLKLLWCIMKLLLRVLLKLLNRYLIKKLWKLLQQYFDL